MAVYSTAARGRKQERGTLIVAHGRPVLAVSMGTIYVCHAFDVDPDSDKNTQDQLLADIAYISTTPLISPSRVSQHIVDDCCSLTVDDIADAISKADDIRQRPGKQRWETGLLSEDEKREQKRHAGIISGETRRQNSKPRDDEIRKQYSSMSGSNTEKLRQLAQAFSVSERTIRRIVTQTEIA